VTEAATTQLRALVPMAPVADVRRSIAFYENLGFEVDNTLEKGGETEWAYLHAGGAHLMLTRTPAPVAPEQQTMLIYLYADDVVAYHGWLREKGLDVGPIERRIYMPKGEFELRDPDGYCLLVGHV
jgi:catechol 2,3-dioxygenase-like lactoylglutathione lyase family enzyme